MDHSTTTATSMAGSHTSLSGYDHMYNSQSDKDRSSRASSVARSDANSEASRYNNARKPINEAVTSAFGDAHQQNAIPPEILSQITSQITANVLQQLKANNLPTPATQSTPAAQPTQSTSQPAPPIPAMAAPVDHVDSSSSFAGSPPLDRSNVYTPPSPHRENVAPTQISPTHSHFSTGSRRPASPPSMTRGVSPHNTTQYTDNSNGKDENVRPKAPQRLSTSDATIMEKCWGKLFVDGQCTARLGQFLRGIALHLVQDYEPRNSLVITPSKMQRYYQDTKISQEYYPWNDIFDDKTSSCSRMFRELQIEHHLIQDNLGERPDIPALTPKGFEMWMMLVLRADPDLEFERLAYTALHMPINNPDDKSERFPKELSRRLFPNTGDKAVAHKLAKALRAHCHVKLPASGNSSSESDSKSKAASFTTLNAGASTDRRQSGAETNGIPSTTARSRRTSYSGRGPTSSAPDVMTESAVDDTQDSTLPSRPIERERKPYVAQPGGGKNYDGVEGVPLSKIQSQPPPLSHLPPLNTADGRPLGRSPSVTSAGRGPDPRGRNPPVALHQPSNAGLDVPMGEPAAMKHRSASFLARESRAVRNRSPSATRSRDYNHRSDPEVKNNSYYSNGSVPSYVPQAGYAWPDPRHDHPRSDQRSSFSGDPREGGREPRARFQSSGSADPHRYFPSEEEYYRQNPPAGYGPDGGYSQYPPSSYRTK